MNQTKHLRRLLPGYLLIAWLTSGCNSGDQTVTPQTDCRIQQIVSTTKTGTLGSITKSTYEYDQLGNLLRKTQTTQADALQQEIVAIDQYTYNVANFLTRLTTSSTTKTTLPAGVLTSQTTLTTDYTYTDNRLTAYTKHSETNETGLSNPQSYTTAGTRTYTYNAAGQLMQTQENGLTATYQNGQVQTYEGSFRYVIDNGLIVKAVFPGTNGTGGRADLSQQWQYDGQRRVVRYEEAINDSTRAYYTQEWQMGKPASASLPTFKGHPLVQSPDGEPGVVTKFQQFYVNQQQGNKAYLFSETITANQLNAQGYVTNSTATTTYSTNGQSPTTTSTIYTYTGCN